MLGQERCVDGECAGTTAPDRCLSTGRPCRPGNPRGRKSFKNGFLIPFGTARMPDKRSIPAPDNMEMTRDGPRNMSMNFPDIVSGGRLGPSRSRRTESPDKKNPRPTEPVRASYSRKPGSSFRTSSCENITSIISGFYSSRVYHYFVRLLWSIFLNSSEIISRKDGCFTITASAISSSSSGEIVSSEPWVRALKNNLDVQGTVREATPDDDTGNPVRRSSTMRLFSEAGTFEPVAGGFTFFVENGQILIYQLFSDTGRVGSPEGIFTTTVFSGAPVESGHSLGGSPPASTWKGPRRGSSSDCLQRNAWNPS